jgi:hypothetical protein
MMKVLLYEDNDTLRESIVSMIALDNSFVVAGAFQQALFGR